MADLYFYRSLETLAWPSFGGHWNAKSGPWGLGELPPGLYTVGRREITDYTSAIDSAYKDKTTGQGFFVPIYPQFSTSRGKSGRLGIHPDGNVSGTEGCIGLALGDTRSFWDTIRSTPPSATIVLQVY